jgi:hypothetical protein
MTRDVRQRGVLDLRPLALLDVEVRAAQPRRADLDDDVERPLDRRLVDLVDLERLAVRMQSRGLNAATSSSVKSYRVRSSPRQSPALPSSDVATSLA